MGARIRLGRRKSGGRGETRGSSSPEELVTVPTEDERFRLGDLDLEGDRDCDLDRERERPTLSFPFLDDLDAFFLPARDSFALWDG